jgi:nitrogenase molybdenum-iron protein alpha/beta subunit/molybdenum cofactor biosynthesis enzyme MoaA/predicted Fe-Mo cluster-binding NifX family protein
MEVLSKGGGHMKGTLANLNVNPCKMCMPMGAVTAMYGIKKCMTILHGSQGCSTYIRRHMATHYNEPVDIASSSLTEEGTVYGGEKNLLQGLINLIKVYEPEVIGVATTCLAETIGEDIRRIIDKFYEENPYYNHITIIPIPSAGYAGTQFEGFLKALYQIVKTVPMDTTKNDKVNVITSQLSPADTRYLKELLEEFGINYILLPDLSDNLDGGYQATYQKLPQEGTDIQDIKKMAGARFSIELSTFTEDSKSVALYLYEMYGVPYKKCNLPVGIRDNDELIKILQEVSGKSIPLKREKERRRYLDAMIDGHKYNGEARAAIYGEPDFVYSTVRMCVENGIMPMIAATGTKCIKLKAMLDIEMRMVADIYYIDRYEILDDVDFQTIEEYARELKVNLLIGNSDGRRISDKLGTTLVRRSFPIHDRMGGQRLRTLGYEGTLSFLDEVSNAILGEKEKGFREQLYKQYYKGEKIDDQINKLDNELEKIVNAREKIGNMIENTHNRLDKIDNRAAELREVEDSLMNHVNGTEKTIEEKTATHPCYTCGAHKYARMHLPIAPKCNISCNYCLRKYDCPNESRPGVTTSILNPEEALNKFLEVKEKVPNLSVVGIAGPGDALANFEETKKTLELIRKADPGITFCLSTNGLMLPQYAEELIKLGVTHVTVTMNSVEPKIGAKVYKYIDYMGIKYYGEAAAAILMSNQLAGIKMMTSRGIVCKVNIVMLKGINDQHIPEVVKKVKELGGTITNIVKLIPVKGSAFEHLPPVSKEEITKMREKCGETLKQMYHCRQCRADAIGTLSNDRSKEFSGGRTSGIQIAVATKSGMLVDQHFGQVSEFYIYEYMNGKAVFKEKRSVKKYCNGIEECDSNESRMDSIIQTIADCTAVIAMRIGDAPKQKLNAKGIQVFTTYDRIEASVIKAVAELLETKQVVNI